MIARWKLPKPRRRRYPRPASWWLVAAGLITAPLMGVAGINAGATDLAWPQFRGPAGDGIADGQSTPVEFGPGHNRMWTVKLPGKAWSSPIVIRDQVWMTTAVEVAPTDEQRDALLRQTDNDEKKFKSLSIAKTIELKALIVDFQSGELLQTIDLATIENPDAIHALNSYASPTPVADAGHVVCHFGAFGTFCLNPDDGNILWQRTLPLQHAVGPGSSPFLHGSRLILIHDGMDRQYVTALDVETGGTLWETDRPPMDAPSGDQKKSYCTPIVVTDASGREQVLCMGSQWMVSLDAQTGDEFWRIRHGQGFSVVPRPVCDGSVVYFATGFGKPELWAARIDGSGDVTATHVLWTIPKGIPAKPSPLLSDGLIYVVDDNGVASCFDAGEGTQIWKKRLGGKFSASPLLAGGYLYLGNHEGQVFVITPGPDAEVIATNTIDDQIMASPAAIDDTLLIRTATGLHRFAEGS